jgi:hypothetical protein
MLYAAGLVCNVCVAMCVINNVCVCVCVCVCMCVCVCVGCVNTSHMYVAHTCDPNVCVYLCVCVHL